MPLIVKFHLLIDLLHQNPIYVWSGLATVSRGRVLPGFSTIDPNIATVSQTLGRAAARELLSGHIPWWNFYQGVGGPLAGEMQSAALFPFSLLLNLPQGQLYMHIVLQICAGLGTFFLMRKLGVSPLAALLAGILFEFNGTFSWLANAVINPIAFLPLILLGVETVRARVTSAQHGGWWWISIGLALSLYAGFPEVAYLNGLLIACWTLARLAGLAGGEKRRYLRDVATGVGGGLLLAAPILIAFFDFLQDGFVGPHVGNGYDGQHLPVDSLLGVVLPYAFGFLFQGDAAFTPAFWGAVGGYAGVVLLMLGLYGALGTRHRALGLTLAGWVSVCLAATYGAPGVGRLLMVVPGMDMIAFFRYLPPSWEFALAILAGFAVDRLAEARSRRAPAGYWIGLSAVMAFIGFATLLLIAHPPIEPLPRWFRSMLIQSLGIGAVILVALSVVGARAMPSERRARIVAWLCAGEAVLYFFLPTLANPRNVELALGAAGFMQKTLGVQRFYTLGPIQPNYGAYFGLASLNHNDLPLPRKWVDHVTTVLDSNTDPIAFSGVNRQNQNGPTAAENLVKNLHEFEKAGVKYIVTSSGYDPFGWTGEAPPPEDSGGSFVAFDNAVLATLPAPPADTSVTGVSVYVRNSRDMAGGSLSIKVCSGDICGEGERNLAESLDNSPFMVPLARALTLPAAPLTVEFRHANPQRPVMLGTFPAVPGSTQAMSIDGKVLDGQELRVVIERGGPQAPRRVYFDKAMTLYELPNPRPYFTAAGCSLQTISRNLLISDCPQASKLLRLEYFTPGWSAAIDGHLQPVTATEQIFQQVDLPAGRATVTFQFVPEYMTAGWAAFAAGLALSAMGLYQRTPHRARQGTHAPPT